MAIPSQGNIIDDVDIYDVFASRIASLANSGVLYGTNSYHFSDMKNADPGPDLTPNYGGTTSGLTQSGWSHNGDPIIASEIVNYMVSEATKYSRIRETKVTRNVTASGGPAETSSSVTGKTHLISSYGSGFVAPSSTNISAGQEITATNLLNYVEACRNEYIRLRDSTVSLSYSVCHNSCHSSCHSSRGRR